METIRFQILTQEDFGVFERVEPGTFDNPPDSNLIREFLADPRHHIVVALDAGTVVAFVSAVTYIHPDKPLNCWINEVSTAPSYR